MNLKFLMFFSNVFSLTVRVKYVEAQKQSCKTSEKKKGKLTNLETRNLAVRALFVVRSFIMN